MTDDILSQEELDALLKDAMGETSGDDEVENQDKLEAEPLTEVEIDTLGEIGNISMGTAATTLSTLLGKKVDITTPTVEITSPEDLAEEYTAPLIAVDVKYKEGLEGSNIMILRTEDVKIITDLMMGKDEVDLERELTDIDLSAVGEAMNQMMGSSSTSMSEMLGMKIDILPPEAQKITFEEGKKTLSVLKGDKNLIKTSFRMVIEGYLDSNLLQIVPVEFGKEMVKKIMGIYSGDNEPSEEVNEEVELENTQENVEVREPIKEEKPAETPSQSRPTQQPVKEDVVQETVVVTRPNIPSFDSQPVSGVVSEIDLVGDIPVEITVELGRTHKKIEEILDFSIGTVVELDKLVGEALSIYANGKYIASGEVVVIDDNFGVRLTEIDNDKQKML